MDVSKFTAPQMGELTPITGTDPGTGPWEHHAFIPAPLPSEAPELSARTYMRIADARAALAELDGLASRLPNPSLLRHPTLRREAQSTSALEGTYAPLSEVLTASEEETNTEDMREILNYVRMANAAFSELESGRTITVGFLEGLQHELVADTKQAVRSPGAVRDHYVVIGRRPDANPTDPPVKQARFVPHPHGDQLRHALGDLADWIKTDHSESMDPVVAAALAHYQFESLHPFHDGNGRIGRLLIVLQFMTSGLLREPTLTVSPWFEARRTAYYDTLFAVSSAGDWDGFVSFFATGIYASAKSTLRQLNALIEAQESMKQVVRDSPLRADSALQLVDFAVANTVFSVRQVQRGLQVSYGRANGLVAQLCELGVLAELRARSNERRFHAPQVLQVLLMDQ
jgi:Fic family protein